MTAPIAPGRFVDGLRRASGDQLAELAAFDPAQVWRADLAALEAERREAAAAGVAPAAALLDRLLVAIERQQAALLDADLAGYERACGQVARLHQRIQALHGAWCAYVTLMVGSAIVLRRCLGHGIPAAPLRPPARAGPTVHRFACSLWRHAPPARRRRR